MPLPPQHTWEFKERGWGYVDWINLVEERNKVQAVVRTVRNF